jgi:adenylate cyclase
VQVTRKHRFGAQGSALKVGFGTNRRMAMSLAKPFTGLMPPLLLLGLCAATLLFDPFGAASAVRGVLFDFYENHTPHAAPADASDNTRVTLVTLDAGSLAHYGRWPWNNQGLSDLTRAIALAGAEGIVFTTPLDRPENGSFPAPLQSVPAVVPILLGVGGLVPHPVTPIAYRGSKAPFAAAPGFSIGAGPLEAIAVAAKGLGAPNLIADRDGVVRRMPLLFRLNNELVPSLAAEGARLAAGEKSLTFATDQDDLFAVHWGVTAIASLDIAGHTIPTDSDGGFWIDAITPPEQISAAALLSRELGPEALKNKILVLDTPDDMVATPGGRATRGAVIAQGVADLIAGTVLMRPGFALVAELWALILAGGSVMLLMARFRTHWAALFVAVTVAVGFYASWFAYARAHLLLDAGTPAIALIAIFASAALMRLSEIRLARAGLRLAFSDSLPSASIEKIAHTPALLSIEGETRTITYLVCGVRGLAELAASLRDNPKAFTQIMQQMITPLMDQALAHGGTIDRLTADGFAAFWNAPLDDADHALHACEAASGMSVVASRISEQIALERGAPGMPRLEIGVGVATGSVIAGGFGGAGRMGYSVNGGVVQLAAQIQALSPQYGPAVIVAENTLTAASRGFAFLEVDFIATGADDVPVRLYALLGNPVIRASPKFRALIAFHEHIFASLQHQQWAKARALIAQCRNLSGASQKLYDLHLTRIGYFESNPPGPEWDGAFRPILK